MKYCHISDNFEPTSKMSEILIFYTRLVGMFKKPSQTTVPVIEIVGRDKKILNYDTAHMVTSVIILYSTSFCPF